MSDSGSVLVLSARPVANAAQHSTAEGGAERIGKRERKKEKEERGGGKSKARIGEILDCVLKGKKEYM